MDFRNTQIYNAVETWLYSGAQWIPQGGNLINIPLAKGFSYTIQSLEASFMRYLDTVGGQTFTDNRVSGYMGIFISRDSPTTEVGLISYSNIPLTRYYKDVPYVNYAGGDISMLRINTDIFSARESLVVYLDSSLAVPAPGVGDVVEVRFRVQVEYAPINYELPKIKVPVSNLNQNRNYRQGRALVRTQGGSSNSNN